MANIGHDGGGADQGERCAGEQLEACPAERLRAILAPCGSDQLAAVDDDVKECELQPGAEMKDPGEERGEDQDDCAQDGDREHPTGAVSEGKEGEIDDRGREILRAHDANVGGRRELPGAAHSEGGEKDKLGAFDRGGDALGGAKRSHGRSGGE